MSGMALRTLLSSLFLIATIAVVTRNQERDWTQVVMWTLAAHLPAFALAMLFPAAHSIPIIAGGMLTGVILLYLYLQESFGRKTAIIVSIVFVLFKVLFHTFWRRIVAG